MSDFNKIIPNSDPKKQKIIKVLDLVFRGIASDIENVTLSSVSLPKFISIKFLPSWGRRLRGRKEHNLRKGIITQEEFNDFCEKQDKLEFKQHGNRKHRHFAQ